MISPSGYKFYALSLVLALAGLAQLECGGSTGAKKTDPAGASPSPAVVEVSTAPAILRQLPRFFEATGSLAPNEQTDVAPSIAGKVVAIGVDLGSFVRRGQMIVRLDPIDSRLRLEQAQAQLAQAQAAVRQAEAKIGLKPGQSFDPTRVAEVSAARVALELAETQLRRAEQLLESGDVSRSSYDQLKAQRDGLREQYEVALAQARQNYAAVQVARTNVANAQAQVGLAQRSLSYALVYSPISGYVSDRPVDLGEYVSPTTKVATVVSINPLRVRIDIPEQAISSVRVGESVSVTVSAYTDRAFAGRIARISPNVSATSRTLTVEAEVDNGDGLLKPGQFATVKIMQPQSTPAVLVPLRAVRREADANRVFVIKNGHAEQRLVQLGQTEGDLVEVKTGVAADELVATSNVDQLNDGMVIRQ
ncbi:MAG TPA: efflux RND transporter periplasmic adaptor subunit [Pyrinomonadaceae bacterium]|jgi:multidrug efflux pump subunit AcrA (membrane-fusion protein)